MSDSAPPAASPERRQSSNLGGARTGGVMSDAGLKIMDRQLSVIKSNWGVEDIWSFFPENIRPKNGYIGSSAISLLRQISDTVSLERGRNLIIEECESTGTTVRVGFAGLSRIWNRLKVNPEAIDTKSADDGSTATSTNADSPLPGSFQTPNNGTTSEKRNGKKNLAKKRKATLETGDKPKDNGPAKPPAKKMKPAESQRTVANTNGQSAISSTAVHPDNFAMSPDKAQEERLKLLMEYNQAENGKLFQKANAKPPSDMGIKDDDTITVVGKDGTQRPAEKSNLQGQASTAETLDTSSKRALDAMKSIFQDPGPSAEPLDVNTKKAPEKRRLPAVEGTAAAGKAMHSSNSVSTPKQLAEGSKSSGSKTTTESAICSDKGSKQKASKSRPLPKGPSPYSKLNLDKMSKPKSKRDAKSKPLSGTDSKKNDNNQTIAKEPQNSIENTEAQSITAKNADTLLKDSEILAPSVKPTVSKPERALEPVDSRIPSPESNASFPKEKAETVTSGASPLGDRLVRGRNAQENALQAWCLSLPQNIFNAICCEKLRDIARKYELDIVEDLEKAINFNINRLQIDVQWIIDKASTELQISAEHST